jgi:hypothetical protein
VHPNGTAMNKDTLLVAYANAMWAAQAMEGRLKALLGLYRVINGTSTRPLPLTDEEFEALVFAADGKTLGQAIHGLLQQLSKLGLGFPSIAEEGLWSTVRIRNFLAHSFFAESGHLIDDEEGRLVLNAQLQWFIEVFKAWLPTLDKWTNSLLRNIGIGEEEFAEVESMFQHERAHLTRDLIPKLRQQLETIGVDVPKGDGT